MQCLRNYIGTSAIADVSYWMADVEAKFYVKIYLTPAKMLLLADVGEYSFANDVYASVNWVSIGSNSGLSPDRRQAVSTKTLKALQA